MTGLGDGILLWLGAYALHSTLFLAAVWLIERLSKRATPALLSALWRLCQAERNEGMSHDSGHLHYCAETALLRDDRERALELLGQAVTAGWREYYIRQHDPYWAALENDPRYRALMARVKADVDRQAVEIARLDVTEDLVAKVDAAVAERRSREEQNAGRPATP